MNASGTFEVVMHPEPPYLSEDGVSLFRARADKRFEGTLEGTSQVEMLGAKTAVAGSAAYVALERIVGSLDGRRGAFVVVHMGTMSGGDNSLVIPIVPDSGTGELTGLRGEMRIRIEGGQHFYDIEWSF